MTAYDGHGSVWQSYADRDGHQGVAAMTEHGREGSLCRPWQCMAANGSHNSCRQLSKKGSDCQRQATSIVVRSSRYQKRGEVEAVQSLEGTGFTASNMSTSEGERKLLFCSKGKQTGKTNPVP